VLPVSGPLHCLWFPARLICLDQVSSCRQYLLLIGRDLKDSSYSLAILNCQGPPSQCHRKPCIWQQIAPSHCGDDAYTWMIQGVLVTVDCLLPVDIVSECVAFLQTIPSTVFVVDISFLKKGIYFVLLLFFSSRLIVGGTSVSCFAAPCVHTMTCCMCFWLLYVWMISVTRVNSFSQLMVLICWVNIVLAQYNRALQLCCCYYYY